MKTEYQLTIMDAGHLPRRLIAEVRFVEDELKRAWPDMKRDPLGFVIQGFSRALLALKRLLLAPNIPAGILTAFLVMVSVVLIVRVLERSPALSVHTPAQNEDSNVGEVVTLTLVKTNDADLGVGLKGKGRVGFERDKGEGSNPAQQRAQGAELCASFHADGCLGTENRPWCGQCWKFRRSTTAGRRAARSSPTFAVRAPI